MNSDTKGHISYKTNYVKMYNEQIYDDKKIDQ